MERYLKDEPKMKFKKEPNDMAPWELFATPGPISGSWSVKVDPLCLDEFGLLGERHLDSLSMSSASSSCSGTSWDSSLSCAVVVKKERMDEDYEDNSDGYEDHEKMEKCMSKNIHIINSHRSNKNSFSSHKLPNSIELRLIARTTTSSSANSRSSLSTGTLSASTLSSMLTPATMQSGQNHDITLTPPSSPESLSKSNSGSIRLSEPDIALDHHQGILRVSTGSTLPRNAVIRLTNGKNTVGVTRLIQVSQAGFQATITQKSTNLTHSSAGTTGKYSYYFDPYMLHIICCCSIKSILTFYHYDHY